MIVFAELFATAAYLLPVAIWTSLRAARRGANEARFAVELAVVVAGDLLSVLLLARVFTLETATLISRVAWVVGGGLFGRKWWQSGGRPTRLDPRRLLRLAELALVIGGAVFLSRRLSRPCAIWDREWHIPLVSALRGQSLPFRNVYDPVGGLFYHFAGNVQAAMLQTLSGGRLHASLALSLLHDIMFALIALNVVSFLRASGIRQTALAALIFGAIVMIGPVTLLRDDIHKLETGFALVNYLTLSFRPHVALAYLLELGFLESVLGALFADDPSSDRRARLGNLAILAAALAITDESSLGLLGVSLGALWLANPNILAPRRRAGLLALVALSAAIVATVVILGGSVGPSAPHYHLALVAPRAPGYASPPVALAAAAGRALMFQDLLPVLGVLAGLIALAVRRRDRVTFGLAVFYTTLAATSIFALTCLDFEGKAAESHRFATALFVAAPLLAALAIARQTRIGGGLAASGIASMVMYLTIGLGVASTVEWLVSGVALRQCASVKNRINGWSSDRFYDVDCRRDTGTRLGESTTQTYVDTSGFYLWAGCHPVFAPAPPVGPGEHKVKIGKPWFGRSAVDQLRQCLPSPSDRLAVVCLTAIGGPNLDPVCARAAALGPCRLSGTAFTSCSLDGPARAALTGIP